MSPGCFSSGTEKAGGDLPAQSLQDAPGQREDYKRLREAILALRGYHGVLGTFSFTPNGDGLH
jgi:hypothetical protein